MTTKSAGEILHRGAIVQYLERGSDPLSVIAPVIATYHRDVQGALSITVRLEHMAPAPAWMRVLRRIGVPVPPRWSGTTIAAHTLDGASLVDNEAVDIRLAPHELEGEGRYVVTIAGLQTQSGLAPTVWLSDGSERIAGHLGCTVNGRHQGEFGLSAATHYAPRLAPSPVPPAILYSPVTQCNLNCIHCVSRHTRKKLQKLPAEFRARLKHFCDEGLISFISTDYSGDLLWADYRFGGELDYLISLDIPFHVDTNGAYLTAQAVDRLLETKLHSVNISLDAATDANFRRVRKGAPPLAEVIEKIRYLVAATTQRNPQVRVSMSFTLMASTLHEWNDFLRMAADAGVRHVYARHLEAYTADMEPDSLWHDKRRYNDARVSAVALAAELGITLGAPDELVDRPARTGHMPCPEPWRSAVILGNGDVAACCVPGMVMGNLNEASLESIWNGPNYQALRATVNSDRPPAPCSSCPMYRVPENVDSYLIHSARAASGVEAA